MLFVRDGNFAANNLTTLHLTNEEKIPSIKFKLNDL